MDTTTLRRRAVATVLTTACVIGSTLALAPVAAATVPLESTPQVNGWAVTPHSGLTSSAPTDAGPITNLEEPGAPANLTPPVIRAAWGYFVGGPLTADPGTWDVDGAEFAYQWQDNGTDIPGATTDSFTSPFAMLNHQLTVTVTATKDGLTSDPVISEPVTIGPGSVGIVTLPTLSGDPRPGSTLTLDPGTADVDTATASYDWYADNQRIVGATSSTYVVTAQDVGRQINAAVTWSAPDYLWGMAFTDSVTIVPGSLTHKAAPRILGTPLVGRTLSVKRGTWSATDGVTLSYQWTIGGKRVAGAIRAQFKVPATAAGKRVGVIETAGGAAYNPASQSSGTVVAKAASTLKLRITKPRKRTVKVTVTVAAAVRATGKVVVKVGHVTRTLVLHGGKATTTVKKLRKGKVKVSAKYAGSAAVTAGKVSTSTRVK